MTRKRDLGILATIASLGIGCTSADISPLEEQYSPRTTIANVESSKDPVKKIKVTNLDNVSTTKPSIKKLETEKPTPLDAYRSIEKLRETLQYTIDQYKDNKQEKYLMPNIAAKIVLKELDSYRREQFKNIDYAESKRIVDACKQFGKNFHETTNKLSDIIELYNSCKKISESGKTVSPSYQKKWKEGIGTLEASSNDLKASSDNLETVLGKYRVER